jgi:2-polyprenyl-6-hydroxyphenyl methylase/3-demethylubiquinone-9 3-methyltransferase
VERALTATKNDQRIYDVGGPWWEPGDVTFAPLRALVPARARYLDREHIDVRGQRVLDVGCGGGLVTELLATRGARVTSVDIALHALRAGQAHLAAHNGTWVQASAQELPFADGSFDVVTCTDVLVHVPDPAAALRECARVLTHNGTLWLSAISKTVLARWVMVGLGEDVLGVVPKGTHDPARFLDVTTVRAHLHAAGMTLVHSEGVGPVGVTRHGELIMGKLPTRAVMWQGHAHKR